VTPCAPSPLSAIVQRSLLVLVGVILGPLPMWLKRTTPERQYGWREMAALMCEDFVKRRLLWLGSAQFPNPLIAGVQIDSVGAGRYTGSSYWMRRMASGRCSVVALCAALPRFLAGTTGILRTSGWSTRHQARFDNRAISNMSSRVLVASPKLGT
jgi:hypothetical protein